MRKKILLKDAPGGVGFIKSLENAAKDLSLLYACTPDSKAQASLDEYLKRIEPGLIEAVGAGPAKIICAGFRSAVMAEKRKIEACESSRAAH
jgi:hypothetical protein